MCRVLTRMRLVLAVSVSLRAILFVSVEVGLVLVGIDPEYFGVSDDEVQKLGIRHDGFVHCIDAVLVPQALQKLSVA